LIHLLELQTLVVAAAVAAAVLLEELKETHRQADLELLLLDIK
jgi:hypothetical protein